MDGKLVTYEVRLPNRRRLKWLIALGWFVVLVGVAMLVTDLYKNLSEAGTKYQDMVRTYEWCAPYKGYVSKDPFSWPSSQLTSPCIAPDTPWWAHVGWYHCVAVLVIGAILVSAFTSRYTKYFEEVRQGKVIDSDSYGGGRVPVGWKLLIEGYTYANELGRQWVGVTHGTQPLAGQQWYYL